MTKRWIWMAAVPLCAAPLVPVAIGQHPAGAPPEPKSEKGRLERVDPGSADAQSAFDAEAWKRDLSAPDLAARERAFERLIGLSARDEAARTALEAWSREGGELAWTARLALRELERHGRRPAFGLRRLDPRSGDLRLRFDDLNRQFGGIDSMLEDLQAQMEELFGDAPGFAPGLPPLAAPAPGARQEAQVFSLEVGPDGVVLRTEEQVDGDTKKREYRADSLEQLYEEHPELRDRVRLQGFGAPFGAPRALGRTAPDGRGLLRPFAESGELRTDVLGIECLKPTPEVAKELGLEPEVGLRVERTQPNTIAHVLGIKRGDVVIEINGTTIYSREDVARTLGERREEAPVAVVLIDAKGQRRTLTWTPEPRAPAREGEGAGGKDESGSREF